MSQVSASDKPTCDPESPLSISDKSSVVEKLQEDITDQPSGVTPASATDNRSDEEKSQVGIINMSVVEEKPQVNTIDKSLGGLESQIGTPGKSGEQERQMSTTDKSEELQSQASTKDMLVGKETSQTDGSFSKEKLQVNVTNSSSDNLQASSLNKSLDDQESHVNITDQSSVEPESQMSTTEKCPSEDKSFKEKSQENIRDQVSEQQESQTSTTDHSSDELKSQRITTDKSSGKEMPPVNSKDQSLGQPESQTGTTDKFLGKQQLPASPIVKSVEEETPKSTKEKFVELLSFESTTDMSSGDGKSHVTSIDHSIEQVSQTGTTDKSVDQKSHVSNVDNSSVQASQDSTIGSREPELHTSIIDKSSDKEMPQVKFEDKSLGELVLQTEFFLNKQESPMGTKDKSDKQDPPTSTTDQFNARESPMATDQFDDQELPSSTTEKSDDLDLPTIVTDKSDEEEPPTSTAEKSGVKTSQKNITEIPGKLLSPASTTDMSPGEKKSHVSTADHPSEQISQDSSIGTYAGIQEIHKSTPEKQQLQMVDNQLKQRRVTHSGAGSPSSPHTKESSIKEQSATSNHWLMGGFLVSAVVMVVLYFLCSCGGQPPAHHESALEKFFKEFASIKKDFPGQNEGLWFRSEKLLQKHLNTSDPSTPSILILTAAQDGERSLRCVSQRLAKSYANSLGARWLMVDGPSMSQYDSATSKMQIDEELSSGFQSDSRAAVLYRLETLPSGSLLILYKYCDHENAAFKNVALVLTVLLDEQSLEVDLSFGEVEEKVKDFLWERFGHSEVGAHNEMDVDKLSGVWSRISHVVLPVLPVESIERGSCPGIKD